MAETKPYLQGLDAFYYREIEPWLRAQEMRRRDALARRRRGTWAAAAVGLVVVGVLWLRLRPDSAAPLSILTLIVFFFASWFAGRSAEKLESDVKTFVMTKLAAFFGFTYEPRNAGPALPRFVELGLVPHSNSRARSDGLSGTIRGIRFQFAEAELERVGQREDSKGRTTHYHDTVFDGLLFAFHYASPCEGVTVIREDAGAMMNWARGEFGGLPPVALDDAEFEAAFRIYSTDDEDARRLLDPSMRHRILALRQTLGATSLRLAFDANGILMSVETKSDEHFEPGPVDKAVLDREHFQRMVADVCIVFDIIDGLNLGQAAAATAG
ncbi:MAG TPA: DUF3137 domain-containing protein [Candidatus Acidoferrum sp.]|nr:DUF3137 domain-containing protein [Candidatus Acidoferrum sp.]